MHRRFRRHAALSVLMSLALPLAAIAQPQKAPSAGGYRLPPPELRAIVDAPRPPQVLLGPKRDLAAVVQTPALPGIDVVAQPELKLAGLRIHPKFHAASRFSFGSGLSLLALADGAETRIEGLPSPLAVASLQWSPDQAHIAFNHVDVASGATELWLVDVAQKRARRLASTLNTVSGRGYAWMPDSRRLLVMLQPENLGTPPSGDGIPSGPAIQETGAGGAVTQIRTYQDLLRNEADAKVFEHYVRAQLALLDLGGGQATLGGPDLFVAAEPSPDGALLLVQRLHRPFSYLVPWSFFPRRIDVLASNTGRIVHTVADLPLFEGLPTGNDAVPTGVRRIDWRSDAPATLAWVEAQDGGDPAKPAAIRDAVLMQAAPFDRPPVTIARLGSRLGRIDWGRGDLALLSEAWWKTRATTLWRIAPDGGRDPQRLFEGSFEDRYADPGTPVTVTDAAGHERLLVGEGETVFVIGDGASPEGDRPFVDRWNLADGAKARLFHSQAPAYERPRALLDAAGTRLLTTRESPTEPANFFVRDGDAAPRALTRFPHPTPQLKEVRKEQIRYRRADGVELTGTLYLPPGYDPKRDGPRPALLWAYPQEFKSAAAASQVTDSPYRFNAVGYWGPQAFLARGWVVLDDPSMPIVGGGDAEPNDTYVPQLVASAQAAVDELVRRGVGDRARMAIGGHSYGAFMTANLLAHSDLFRAGIARSGAYNRTLTPFGFQAEERNYWQARDTYLAMSPFNVADRIDEPLLLIHGEQDNNSGTFPIQSERLFAAIKGLGGTARLVMLPNESHGYRARESILHMLAETDAWLERHVRGEAGATAPSSKRAGK
ncbi:S9 family peptidase [Tolypothrix campylonemoides VB511288]|nr:S9 family peptidase [Tolypothrix campylonemoides VB511288]